MKKIIFFTFLFLGIVASAEVTIPDLPLVSGSSIGSSDSFPFWSVGNTQTSQLLLSSLFSIPSLQNPTFASVTGTTVTGTTLSGTDVSATAQLAVGQSSVSSFSQAFISVGNGVTGTSIIGLDIAGRFPSTTTSQGTVFSSAVGTAVASYVQSALVGFEAGTPAIGSGSTLTRNIGFLAENGTVGSDNAAFCDNTGFTGNYFINQTGTTQSLFSGPTSINNQAAVGTTGVNSAAQLAVSAGGQSGTTNYGIELQGTFPSTATGVIAGYSTNFANTATNYSVGFAAGYLANSFTAGAGSTVTRYSSFYSSAQSSATNNAEFADNSSYSGNWSLNLSSTNAALIGGATTLGNASTTPTHSINTATSATASGIGTLTNMPTGISGNPAGYIAINVNGVAHVIPYW